MESLRYKAIFASFENAHLEDFMNELFLSISEERRKELVWEDVSYHRLSANVATLEARMYITPIESNHWIWARIEMDDATGRIKEFFYTNGTYLRKPLLSLRECIDYYKE